VKYEVVREKVEGLKHTTPEKGKELYETILSRKAKSCLELGFAHGVGSAYVTAALEEQGFGKLTSVDQTQAQQRKPRADDVIRQIGLSEYVEFVFHEISYTWFLMDAVEQSKTYDFVFLDGAHTWDVDGFSFLLLERILAPGGLIIFDDLDWTYAKSPSMAKIDVPEVFRQTAQVRKVYEILVKSSPVISKAWEKDGWAYAERAA